MVTPNSCDPKICPWHSGRCPIALDEKVKGVEKIIEERKGLNEERYQTAQRDIKLAKLEADKDISSITATLKQISDTLGPIAAAISSQLGGKRWTDQIITVIVALIASAIMTFIFGHK